MSISARNDNELNHQFVDDYRSRRIQRQILLLFSDARLKGKINISTFTADAVQIQLFIYKDPLHIKFDQDFPDKPPKIGLNEALLSRVLVQSDTLDSWSPTCSLADAVYEVYANVQNYVESQISFSKNSLTYESKGSEQKLLDGRQSSDETIRRKVMMNGCADNELTETKNLNRHFRSKLRQVYYDLVKKLNNQIPEDAKWIEESFTMSRVGFEDIARVLKNEWFSREVEKQMQNGRFMHKIMKGMMSIKSKKLMVKYYHVMLAAVKDPDNFVKWKYQ